MFSGTGKSTIATEFAARLEDKGRLGATFMFTRNSATLSSVKGVVPTITWQLAHHQSALRGPLAEAAQKHQQAGTIQGTQDQVKDLITGALGHLNDTGKGS